MSSILLPVFSFMEAARDPSLSVSVKPGRTLLMLYSGVPWLTDRLVTQSLRKMILEDFEDIYSLSEDDLNEEDVVGDEEADDQETP